MTGEEVWTVQMEGVDLTMMSSQISTLLVCILKHINTYLLKSLLNIHYSSLVILLISPFYILGTGKIRPFVDKKDFFNDVRQKKRLLRELGDGEDSLPNSPRSQQAANTAGGVIPTQVGTHLAS